MGTWEAQRRGGFLRAVCLAALLSTFPAAWAAPATAEPASGPREDIDQSFTTRSPGAATGVDFTARYHAAGDPNGEPPYMRKMIFHPPGGMRYDTSVPGQCTASDPQLQLMGPAACPADSKLGSGTVDGIFKVPFSEDLVFDRYHHPVHVFNNADEQILLIESEGYTVVRGKIRDDGSIEVAPTTCFPAVPGVDCADDYIVQLATSTSLAPYTKDVGGAVRSYVTTPPACPADGFWRYSVQFFWGDGSVDDVVSRQPCVQG